jgi:hypothetical protein
VSVLKKGGISVNQEKNIKENPYEESDEEIQEGLDLLFPKGSSDREHSYLNELGANVLDDESLYGSEGFDHRQAWNLDYSMAALLYERLCFTKEDNDGFGRKVMNADISKPVLFDVADANGKVQKMDSAQAGEFLLTCLKKFLSGKDKNGKYIEAAWNCWAKTRSVFWY